MSIQDDPLYRSATLEEFRRFSTAEVLPFAGGHDRDEKISRDLIGKLANRGYLGALVSRAHGGLGMDYLTFGLLNLELGKACTAVRSLVTVQSMVCRAIERWGTEAQKKDWLDRLSSGDRIAGFALSEPDHGSDAAGVRTTIAESADSYIVNGHKKWISFGQIADVFLVIGRQEGKLSCLILERNTPGLRITPIRGLLGAGGTMLAALEFDNCRVPKTNLVGGKGFGLHPVGFTALDLGRYSIAWGCVGMAEACLETSIAYARSRKQFGSPLSEFQLVQRLISDMMVDIKAARLLCEQAGRLRASGDRAAMQEMLVAKYYAAGMAIRVTGKAVQILGANGYSRQYPVERFFRDAKIMETIEGSNQMMQIMIAKYGFQEA